MKDTQEINSLFKEYINHELPMDNKVYSDEELIKIYKEMKQSHGS